MIRLDAADGFKLGYKKAERRRKLVLNEITQSNFKTEIWVFRQLLIKIKAAGYGKVSANFTSLKCNIENLTFVTKKNRF